MSARGKLNMTYDKAGLVLFDMTYVVVYKRNILYVFDCFKIDFLICTIYLVALMLYSVIAWFFLKKKHWKNDEDDSFDDIRDLDLNG